MKYLLVYNSIMSQGAFLYLFLLAALNFCFFLVLKNFSYDFFDAVFLMFLVFEIYSVSWIYMFYSFHQIWKKKFYHYFFNIIYPLCLLRETNYIFIRMPEIFPQFTDNLFIQIFSPLCLFWIICAAMSSNLLIFSIVMCNLC